MTASLSLIGHSADVAAVMTALLEQPVIARRLARLLGRDELTAEDRARLAALAALHDLGKINLGFQNQPFDCPGPKAGHVTPLVSLFANYADAAKAAKKALWEAGRLERLAHLIEPGRGRWPFDAIMAHHGSLPKAEADYRADLWRAAGGYDPIGACLGLVEAIEAWFPAALALGPIDWSSPFGHAFAGLLTLADWLGSDETKFLLPPQDGAPDGPDRYAWALPRAHKLLRQRGIAPDDARAAASALTWTCAALTGFAQGSAAQATMLSLPHPPQGGRTCLIEDETGSGKTEAALIHFLRLFEKREVDGMYFALPTRAAARQIHARIKDALNRLLGADAAGYVTLAVPGYIGRQAAGGSLPEPTAHWPDTRDEARRDALWASERPKRYLAGWVAVGTIDQVLMGGLRVRHAQLRSGAMLRLLLVVDEVHASDVYMTTILRNVLDQHRRAGGHALLMSATLGSAARAKFLMPAGRANVPALQAAMDTRFPAIWTDAAPQFPLTQPSTEHRGEKSVDVAMADFWNDTGRIVARATDAARQGAQVLVIRNTVRDVIATQAALESAAPDFSLGVATAAFGPVRCPHHARYAPEDRSRLDAALESVLGKDAPRLRGSVTITSQTAEQSLDIDADLLITDLCPADVLLQRIGRLHRHRARLRPAGFEQPVVMVLTPSKDELTACIDQAGGVRNPPLALGLVYPDLLGVVATRRILEQQPSVAIPRDNRRLVETATHPDSLSGLAETLGGPWVRRWASQEGTKGAHVGAATDACLKWKERIKPLSDLERIVARLGLGDRIVELPAGTVGPFGGTISLLTVPGRWLGGVASDAVPTVTATGPRAWTVGLGERVFVYDRLGLRPKP